MGVGSCEGLLVVGEAVVLGVAGAVDDFASWEHAGDQGDHEHVVWLLVGDDSFIGDIVVVGCGEGGHIVDDALVVDKTGDWEGESALGVWEGFEGED